MAENAWAICALPTASVSTSTPSQSKITSFGGIQAPVIKSAQNNQQRLSSFVDHVPTT
jgi:hypothetical protein